MKILFTSISIIIFSITSVFAQKNYSSEFYNLFVTSDMKGWKLVMSEIEHSDEIISDKELLFELTISQYGYIGYCIGVDDSENAEIYIEKASENIEKLLNFDNNWAEIYALRGIFCGFGIYLSAFKAIFLLPQSIENLNKALEIDKNCFMCQVEKANQMYFTPSFVGGDKEEALLLYEKAVKNFDDNFFETENWYYLNVIRHLAEVYEKNGEYEKANDMYLKTLKYEPDFKWVKEELYPEFQIRYRNWVRQN